MVSAYVDFDVVRQANKDIFLRTAARAVLKYDYSDPGLLSRLVTRTAQTAMVMTSADIVSFAVSLKFLDFVLPLSSGLVALIQDLFKLQSPTMYV